LLSIDDNNNSESDIVGWQLLPGEENMDGFYYAKLLKNTL
jgi:hypothetical protein